MKKLLTLTLFLFVTLCYLGAQAGVALQKQTTVDGIDYYLWDNQAAVISHSDAVGQMKEIIVPSQINYRGTQYAVSKIYLCAFVGCKASRVQLPNTIKSIDTQAFKDCKQLSSIQLPDSLEKIEDEAFSYTAIKALKFPSSLKTLGHNAFADMYKLESFQIDERNTSFNVEDGVLYSKDKFKLIAYPIAKPDTLFRIPNSVERIGENAFAHCSNLVNIKMSDNLKYIDKNALVGCRKLERIDLPMSLKFIGYGAFAGARIKRFELPNLITWLDDEAFSGSDLEYVKLPESIKILNQGVFRECKKLKSINIPDSITHIYYSFDFCKFESISLPASLKEFRGYDSEAIFELKELTIQAKTPPILYDLYDTSFPYIFENINPNCILKVPESAIDVYKKTYPWNRCKNIVSNINSQQQ